jgi:hypothetical protein
MTAQNGISRFSRPKVKAICRSTGSKARSAHRDRKGAHR